MKKIYNFLFALLFVSASFSMSYGQQIFSESFNYPVGTTLNANGWTAVAGNQSATHSIQNDPTFGVGNSAAFSIAAGATPLPTLRFDKAFPATYAGDADANGDVYWLGFWLKTTGDATTYAVAMQVNLMNGSGTTTDQRLGIGKTSNYASGANSANAISAFTRASTGGCAAQNWPSAFNVVSPTTVPLTAIGTNYVLMKITKGEFNLNVGTVAAPVMETFDGVRVWVLTAPPANEAALSSLPLGNYTTVNSDMVTIPAQTRLLRSMGNTGNTACRKSGVSGVRIRLEGSTANGFAASIDEIRFGKGDLLTVLPIELSNFTATKKGQSNLLTWATGSERNNKGFHIERSSDATHWNTIGFEKGAGDSNKALTYKFTDNSPLGVSYYRLRQTDLNGHESVSKIVSVEQKGKLGVILTPNPAKDVLNVTIQTETKEATIAVYDMVGRQVLTNKFSGTQSALNVAHLNNGIYMMHVQSEGKTTIQKFIKD